VPLCAEGIDERSRAIWRTHRSNGAPRVSGVDSPKPLQASGPIQRIPELGDHRLQPVMFAPIPVRDDDVRAASTESATSQYRGKLWRMTISCRSDEHSVEQFSVMAKVNRTLPRLYGYEVTRVFLTRA
jgi:hypothetical protein